MCLFTLFQFNIFRYFDEVAQSTTEQKSALEIRRNMKKDAQLLETRTANFQLYIGG